MTYSKYFLLLEKPSLCRSCKINYSTFFHLQTGKHYCSKLDGNCGNVVAAVIWFISYYILITFIFFNIVIAHLLENFSIFYNEDDTSLTHTVIKDYRENWLHFDKRAQVSLLWPIHGPEPACYM